MYGQEQCLELDEVETWESRWAEQAERLRQDDRDRYRETEPLREFNFLPLLSQEEKEALRQEAEARESVHIERLKPRKTDSSSSISPCVCEPILESSPLHGVRENIRSSTPRGHGIRYSQVRANSRIVAALLAGNDTSATIATSTGISLGTTKRKLASLVDHGVLFRRGKARATTYHLDEREAVRS